MAKEMGLDRAPIEFWKLVFLVPPSHQISKPRRTFISNKCCRVKGCKRNGEVTWGKAAGPESRPKCADPRLAWCWSVLAWRLQVNTLAASWRQRNLTSSFFCTFGDKCFKMCIQCFLIITWTWTALVLRTYLQILQVWLQYFSARAHMVRCVGSNSQFHCQCCTSTNAFLLTSRCGNNK